MPDEVPPIDMALVYWHHQSQQYRLSIVAGCKNYDFSFATAGKVCLLASHAMKALSEEHGKVGSR